MPRFLFQLVLERVRRGMSTEMACFLKAEPATLSARLTILPSVTLSRAFTRLFTRSDAGFFAINCSDFFQVIRSNVSFRETCLFQRTIGMDGNRKTSLTATSTINVMTPINSQEYPTLRFQNSSKILP